MTADVGVWRSHDKKQAKGAHHKGALGRLIALDPWGNGTSVLIAKGSAVQDPELVMGRGVSCTNAGLSHDLNATHHVTMGFKIKT